MSQFAFEKPTVARLRHGGARSLTVQAMAASKRARRELVVGIPLLVAAVVANAHRTTWFGAELRQPVRYGLAFAILGLGWWLARAFGRSVSPMLFRRMDAATAGTMAFVVRLFLMLVTTLTVLSVAGIDTGTLAVGGALFAVIFGLAAQQTLGNVIAGLVLIAAQPFRVGDRVRLQAGGLAGQLEGIVAAHGLLYTIFSQGEESIMVPNNIVVSAAVVPLREPAGVDLRARLRPDVKPSDVQRTIDEQLHTAVRGEARIMLEELDSDEVVVRITATPENDTDGPQLADEILGAIAPMSQEGFTGERELART